MGEYPRRWRTAPRRREKVRREVDMCT